MVEWVLIMMIGFLILLLILRAFVAVVMSIAKGLEWLFKGGN